MKELFIKGVFLTVIFGVLRISGAVDWNVAAVLSPLIAIAVIILMFVVYGVIKVLVEKDGD